MSFQRPLALLLLGWATVAAQEPEEAQPGNASPEPAAPAAPAIPAPPGVPVPGAVPGLPAGAPGVRPGIRPGGNAAANANIPRGEQKIVEDIIEPKLTGTALAGLYRQYTGRRVIVSAAAAAAEFAFVQEASVEDPLTKAEAAELLKKAATIENFVFVPHPNDPSIDVLTLATGGIRPSGIGLGIYNENGKVFNENSILPEGDAVISYVMSLDYIKPAEAVNTFTQIIGQLGAFGSIAAVPNASAVVITENTSLIRKLIDLKGEIDKPGSVQATRFIKVQFADVTEIATTLTELLTAQQSTQTTAGVQRADAPAPAPGGAPATPGGQGGSGGGEATPVQIIPEPRTNRIFAMGRPVDLIFVEGLVREFDIPTSDKIFLRRKLRFLTVSEFLPIASDALTRAFSGTGEGGSTGGSSGGGGSAATGNRQTSSRQTSSGSSNRNSSSGSNSSSFGNSSSGFGGSSSGGFGGSSGGGLGGGSSLDAPSVSSAPESVLVGRTLLVADNITNSIVVQGPPSGLEIIERLLDQIDVKPDQVMISTVIGQLTLSDGMETGVDYIYRGQDVVGRGGAGLFPSLPIINQVIEAIGEPGDPDFVPAQNAFNPGALSGSGLRVFGKIDNLSIYLKALQAKTDFTVLSRPSIFTSNNQKGTISSGERIAIPTSSNSFNNGGASTNIEYQDVVLKLEVIPLVNSDNEITMQIAMLNDEQNGVQTIAGAGSNGDDLQVPRISTREILTTATVPNNDTIVLGGLIVAKNNQAKSGVPILSDIPYLGRLFSDVTDRTDRTELMVFIQPTIVKNDRSLAAVQAAEDTRYKVSGDVRDFADGDSVLPGMNDIARMGDKGNKGGSSLKSNTSESSASGPYTGTSNVKRSIRPAHKR